MTLRTRAMPLIFSICSVLAAISPASAKAVIDCPMRDLAFSTRSPLIDLLLSPAAKAVIDREAPTLLPSFSQMITGTTPPAMSAIMTLVDAGKLRKGAIKDMARLDRLLAALPVTQKDREVRCARYDDDPVDLVLPGGRPRILLFEKINGFRDEPSVNAAHVAFMDMARRSGWAMVATDKGGAITSAQLARFDAVIWNNVAGDALTLTQRKVLKHYVEEGGGFIGVHGSAGDRNMYWDWYADTLIGARFIGHPSAQWFQDARIRVEDTGSPVTRGLPGEWTMNDEWYSFRASPRATGATILATLDESSYTPEVRPGESLRMGDHPIAWTRCVGRGRSFYSAIGHRPETYSDTHYVVMLRNAVAWAASRQDGYCARKALTGR